MSDIVSDGARTKVGGERLQRASIEGTATLIVTRSTALFRSRPAGRLDPNVLKGRTLDLNWPAWWEGEETDAE